MHSFEHILYMIKTVGTPICLISNKTSVIIKCMFVF